MTGVADRVPARPGGRQPNRRGEGARLREELLRAGRGMVEAQGARQVSLRGIARQIGVAATSVYLHFPDVDHLLAAIVEQGFAQLTAATAAAAQGSAGPVEELRVRCRTYCHFALDHPHLYELMFQADLPLTLLNDPAGTPGQQAFANLVAAVGRCLAAGLAPPHEDAFRLASLLWAAEHGLVLARIARPAFPWAPLDALVDEMITRLMGFDRRGGG